MRERSRADRVGVLARMRAGVVAAALAVGTASGVTAWPAPAGAGDVTAPHCGGPVFIGVPGSGQHGFSNEMTTMANDVKSLSGGTAVLEPALNYEAIPWYQ